MPSEQGVDIPKGMQEARQITIDFLPTGVIGQYAMQLSYRGIPEGWPFVHRALCDMLHQVGANWAEKNARLVLPATGVSQ